MQHILSTQQFLDKNLLEAIFRQTDFWEKISQNNTIDRNHPLANKILACIFYEPSTRTRLSFESAMLRLGGRVISTESAGHFSSAIKGEILEDSIRVISEYADFIVLRHSEAGSAIKAAAVSSVPVINAGDGDGEHPTQALLDFYTIQKELNCSRLTDLNGLKIALAGDLRYGRTIHSLIHLISILKDVEIFLVSPPELTLPQKFKNFLQKKKIKWTQTNKINDALPLIDMLYMTRIQKERFIDEVKNPFILNKKLMKSMQKHAIIMHPLPRAGEIDPEVDSDPRSAYFRQATNGLYVRMALLDILSQ